MADLSPERREELADYFQQWFTNGDELTRAELLDDADAIAPLIAGWLAAEREAGAAEVRARVEAVLAKVETGAKECRADQRAAKDPTEAEYWAGAADHLWATLRDLQDALNGGES